MTQTNTSNKKRFPAIPLLITGAVAIVLIAILLTKDGLGKRAPDVLSPDQKVAESKQLIRANLGLQQQFSKIQELDQEYNLQVFNGAAEMVIDSLSAIIEQQERSFGEQLKMLREKKDKYNLWENVQLTDSITAMYIQALSNRKYMSEIRERLNGEKISFTNEDQRLIQLEQSLQAKDRQIMALQSSLKKPRSIQEPAAPSEKVTELEFALSEEENRSAALMKIVDDLKEEKEKLYEENRRKESGLLAGTEKKYKKLQQELLTLNAELAFAQIDCSLTRADAKKIISTSRQRTALLQSALQSLQALAVSENDYVSRKAKEKLVELNEIASTVRD